MQSRFNKPTPDPTPAPEPSSAQFLSTSPLQDPTLRTPGSEIPETVYAASDSQSLPPPERDFHDRSRSNSKTTSPPNLRNSRSLALVLALALAALVITAVCLLRYLRRPSPNPVPPEPVHASTRLPAPESADLLTCRPEIASN